MISRTAVTCDAGSRELRQTILIGAECTNLGGRVIHRRLRLRIEPDVAHIARHADNRPGTVSESVKSNVSESAQNDGLPDRVLIRPVLPRHRFADDDCRYLILAIAPREVSPAQGNTHRGEVARAHQTPARRGLPIGFRARDLNLGLKLPPASGTLLVAAAEAMPGSACTSARSRSKKAPLAAIG